MNLFFLLEGKRTEPKVYQKWIEHTFPQLTRVYKTDDIISDCFYIRSAEGYPRIIQLIENSLIDMNNHYRENNTIIEHFFICLDSDEENYQTRFQKVEIKLIELKHKISIQASFETHIIIQHCCIETWFLGNRKMLCKNPQSKKLLEFKKFYDVSINDPELMDCPEGYLTKVSFHIDYLKEMLQEQNPNLTYTKKYPGPTTEKTYLNALRQRCQKTGHLSSLKKLLNIWDNI